MGTASLDTDNIVVLVRRAYVFAQGRTPYHYSAADPTYEALLLTLTACAAQSEAGQLCRN